jgi:O-acetyl-ADP-ribose deacetylase (regulator of RNase III)
MLQINYVIGDATEPIGKGAKIIVHCANDIGAWGAGFVIALSRRWPQPEAEYRRWAGEQFALPLGAVQYVGVSVGLTVANLIGQCGVQGYSSRPPIRYGAIGDGLANLGRRARLTGESIHMPRIGCGLAGGSWDMIEPIISETLCARDIPVYVYDLPAKGDA